MKRNKLSKRVVNTFLKKVEVNLSEERTTTDRYWKTLNNNIWNKKIVIPYLRSKYNLDLKGRGSRKRDGNNQNLSWLSPYCERIALYFRVDYGKHNAILEKLNLTHKWYEGCYKRECETNSNLRRTVESLQKLQPNDGAAK